MQLFQDLYVKLNQQQQDAVNAVGVDLNTASVPFLSKVSGLNAGLAKNIVAFRDSKGRFNNREALKEVPRLGDKAFEQAAGFLRISGGDNPLDQSSVHPESYPLVEKMMKQLGQPVTEVIGNKELLKKVAANDVIQKLVDVYVQNRTEEELFIDTYRRIGATPFKERVYAKAN